MFWYNFHWDDEDNRDDIKRQDDNTIEILVIVRLWYKIFG